MTLGKVIHVLVVKPCNNVRPEPGDRGDMAVVEDVSWAREDAVMQFSTEDSFLVIFLRQHEVFMGDTW